MSTVHSWVADTVFYQIFPERFDNGDRSNDPPDVQPWGGKPKPHSFFGGDIRGILNRMDYLKGLGINALYLNPVFAADSHHKYNTKDYLAIDPAFGTNELFETLIAACHANGIRIVIDGVFNHIGTAHFAFRDVKEKGRESIYASWFNIYSFPVSEPRHPNYECWWGYGSLPKLMVQNPDVKKYLFDVTRFWTEKGIDGWRLDVPNELPHEFWQEWRALVRSINSECYIVGELWDDASSWLRGDEFDATMNYRFRQACLDYFVRGDTTSDQFLRQLESVRSSYPAEANYAMQNLLGSHDTERYFTLCHRSVGKMAASMIFQMSYLGAPMVYYGDEIGMEGGKDPDCRRCMEWDENKWNSALLSLTKKLIRLRHSSKALRRGDFVPVPFRSDASDDIVAFTRSILGETVLVLINRANVVRSVECRVKGLPESVRDELTGKKFSTVHGNLTMTLPGYSGIIIHIQKGD